MDNNQNKNENENSLPIITEKVENTQIGLDNISIKKEEVIEQNQNTNIENIKQDEKEEKEKVIIVGEIKKDGQKVCPACGASQITPNPKTGKLKCAYCGTEFDGKALQNIESDIKKLQGTVRGLGTTDINNNSENIITLSCGGCGAEVVIDTKDAAHARCHWCRSILSVNSKIDNGTVPDVILPFGLTKETAQNYINKFVKKRRFFANPVFKKEFTTDNIMGVYFPYLIVDGNCHATFKGQGEKLVKEYYVGSKDNREKRYDADLYYVIRDFDITIDDLTVESSSERLDKTSNAQTNNIINSILPFDTENCIQYEGNYLVGYTSERRNVNIDDLEEHVAKQFKDIAKFAAKEDAKAYNRGIRWDYSNVDIKGSQWLSAYLPVWLYSYQEVKGNKKTLHYVAVNARTGETMGSIPINKPLLFIISTIIEFILGTIGILLFLATDSDEDSNVFFLALLASGFIFYGAMYLRYRNQDARHTYEKETKKEIDNMQRDDTFIEHRKKLKSPFMEGRNDNKLEGDIIADKSFFEKKFDEIKEASNISKNT